MEKTIPKLIALLGNPNAGKSSVFNIITGLRQKIGNFPGVTVEKHSGICRLPSNKEIIILDLPGTYSLFPTSIDERIVLNCLTNKKDIDYPDAVIYVADVCNLERHLLLFTQIADLGFPMLLVITMNDLALAKGIKVNFDALSDSLHTPIVVVNGNNGLGKENLFNAIENNNFTTSVWYKQSEVEKKFSTSIQANFDYKNSYLALLIGHHFAKLPYLSHQQKADLSVLRDNESFNSISIQMDEILERYKTIQPIIINNSTYKVSTGNTISDKIDNILTHKIIGPILFLCIMVIVFNSIFTWSSIPMDFIDNLFRRLQLLVIQNSNGDFVSRFIAEGLLPGLGGIMMFIPQIAILFFLISILEEVGYMSRVVYMFDRIMQRFGMNGRSIVALISGGACAIPAIMSTRTISNWKERLITILVTPLISCSARLPVYTMLVSFLVIDNRSYFGFNKKTIIFTALYLIGAVFALLSAWVFKKILKSHDFSFLLLELPSYKVPSIRNILHNVFEKVGSFVVDAGRIIIIVSLVLWVLSSYGPTKSMENGKILAEKYIQENNLDSIEAKHIYASYKMESSYAGLIGKAIEPAIAPLGFDWKIGIALISSFTAREVFVGTMATLYSIGDDYTEESLHNRLAKQKNKITGKQLFDRGTAAALIMFYLFAMQCMSTLAVVKRETHSWKWPLVQFVFMGILAYSSAWLAQYLL
jgi:ferrous iron transport protein B